jgi:glutaminyl-tRNA synthetase
VTRDEKTGEITEVRCTYDPETKSGSPQSGRRVKGTVHWVDAGHAISAEGRLYDRLFKVEDPGGADWKSHINPDSLDVLKERKLAPGLSSASHQDRFQFERVGYFCVDDDSRPGALVFNRAVTLRDTWAKISQG